MTFVGPPAAETAQDTCDYDVGFGPTKMQLKNSRHLGCRRFNSMSCVPKTW